MNTKSFRIVGGPAANPPTTDFLDLEVIITMPTSGAVGNILQQGMPIIADITSLVTNNTTTPVIEQAVTCNHATSGGVPLGIYQGATVTNASTVAQSSVTTLIRKQGYGIVYAGGQTTSVTVGGVLSVVPGAAISYAMQVAPAYNVLQKSATYYLGGATATGATSTIGGVILAASTTSVSTVNAYINVQG